MAHEPFTVEVLTPEGAVFKDEVEMVSTRTSTGSIGLYAHHQPVLGQLVPTELRLYRSETEIVRFAQGEGYVQVDRSGNTLLLVEEAIRPEDLDTALLKEKLATAERELADAEPGSEAARVAGVDKRRYEAFLAIAGS
ncbi:MAG: F0F1 ATP synthase subunit epsilon [Baekduia sp.]